MFDSRDIAAYIAQQCQEKNIVYNNTKIQKLLYCAYGLLFAWSDERICDEYPRAWQYGPVFPKVFNYFHKHREIACYSRNVEKEITEHDNIRRVISTVLNNFGKYPATTLSAWTHKKGSPWDKAVNGFGEEEGAGLQGFIPDGYIKEYFKKKVLANV